MQNDVRGENHVPAAGEELPPVLFEDDHLIAFNKPSGLLCVPDRWNKQLPNLMGLVHAGRSPEINNVHRLDRDTSGVLLCAKTKQALDAVCKDFEARRVEKHYLALVAPAPDWDEKKTCLPLAPDPRQPGRMRVHPQGKEAATLFWVRQRWPRHALVAARPLTGRTHQIRVHLAAEKSPVLGDRFYGGTGMDDGAGRLMLHAEKLVFQHPVSGQAVTITATLPDAFSQAIQHLNKE